MSVRNASSYYDLSDPYADTVPSRRSTDVAKIFLLSWIVVKSSKFGCGSVLMSGVATEERSPKELLSCSWRSQVLFDPEFRRPLFPGFHATLFQSFAKRESFCCVNNDSRVQSRVEAFDDDRVLKLARFAFCARQVLKRTGI